MSGTICSTQISNNPPLNKESPCKLLFTPRIEQIFLSPKQKVRASLPHSEKIMCSIEVTPLHCIGKQYVLHEAPGALQVLHWRQHVLREAPGA